jgi:hypothetical protein
VVGAEVAEEPDERPGGRLSDFQLKAALDFLSMSRVD